MSGMLNKVKSALSHDSSSNNNATGGSTASRVENSAEIAAHNHQHNSTNTGSTTDRLENKAVNAAERHEHNSTSNVGSTGIAADSSRTGAARETVGSTTGAHEHAHPPHHSHHQPAQDGLLGEAEAKLATHDHQHLAPVTHETRQTHEIEEIERQREVDRHVHHVQHHVQPVLDTQHGAEVQKTNIVAPTEVRENHVATDEDKANFAALNTAHNTVTDAGKERVIIDKGETVHENTHHHVHHVVQPEINRDVHEHTRIQTTVPVHQTVHEAPIVHQSTQHQPLRMDEFVAGGGDLKSNLTHDANLLNVNGEDCSREVSGPGETGISHHGHHHGNTGSSTGSTTSAAGTTGGAL